MTDFLWYTWLGACIFMIRYADTLPLWADLTVTFIGFAGIVCAVILNHKPADGACR